MVRADPDTIRLRRSYWAGVFLRVLLVVSEVEPLRFWAVRLKLIISQFPTR